MQHFTGPCQAVGSMGQVAVNFTAFEGLDDQINGRYYGLCFSILQLLYIAFFPE